MYRPLSEEGAMEAGGSLTASFLRPLSPRVHGKNATLSFLEFALPRLQTRLTRGTRLGHACPC